MLEMEGLMKDIRHFARTIRTEGFTLAELLIVLAIIAVLVAIAIPVFSGSIESAKKATDEANIRSAKSVAAAAQLTNQITVDGSTMTLAQAFNYAKTGASPSYKALFVTKDATLSKNQTANTYQIQTTFKYLDSSDPMDAYAKGEHLIVAINQIGSNTNYVLSVYSQ